MPRPQTDGGDLGTSVQSERLAADRVNAFQSEGGDGNTYEVWLTAAIVILLKASLTCYWDR